jgi:hypothetical protein
MFTQDLGKVYVHSPAIFLGIIKMKSKGHLLTRFCNMKIYWSKNKKLYLHFIGNDFTNNTS